MRTHGQFTPWSLHTKNNLEAERETLTAAIWELLRINQAFCLVFATACKNLETAYDLFLSRLNNSELTLQKKLLVEFHKRGMGGYEKMLWKDTKEKSFFKIPRSPEHNSLLKKMEHAKMTIFSESKPKYTNSSKIGPQELLLETFGDNDPAKIILGTILGNTFPAPNTLPEYKILSEILEKTYVQLSPTNRIDIKNTLDFPEYSPLSDPVQIVTLYPENCLHLSEKHPNHYICGFPIPPLGISHTKLKTMIRDFVEESRNNNVYPACERNKSVLTSGENFVFGINTEDYEDQPEEVQSYYLFAVSKYISKGSKKEHESQIYKHLSAIISRRKRFSLESIIGSPEAWDQFLSWKYVKSRYSKNRDRKRPLKWLYRNENNDQTETPKSYFAYFEGRIRHRNAFYQRLAAYYLADSEIRTKRLAISKGCVIERKQHESSSNSILAISKKVYPEWKLFYTKH